MATAKKRTPAQEAAIRAAQEDKDTQDATDAYNRSITSEGLKRGGKVKKMASGGYVKAADGIARKGKTRGMMC